VCKSSLAIEYFHVVSKCDSNGVKWRKALVGKDTERGRG